MNQKPVYLFAKWQVREGQLDEVLKLLPELASESSKEEGNIFFKIHQGISHANTLMLFECYVDVPAVEAHRNSDHFKRLVLGRIVPNLENRESLLASELSFDE
ncbi:antibiotic biosynthesis monooxygenase [Segetibacter sp. 3557_3]|uniref:putative quinol monooxygenase n=1 Tax=Segetibacter sp. 3557_3 TaxID=2547429 RepID=UPI001058C7C4|nr:putative quinol monooxygenase [Segetibacter sp. 3557_3]TDH17919.1 antibiotic biosynthesis monooxygenase [Segetibacter sp. 3557_3]